MHGEIKLESSMGSGTKATFWIPFNKAPYQSGDAPMLEMGPLPDRLQSDLAVSDYTGLSTPASPTGGSMSRQLSLARNGAPIVPEENLTEDERQRIHVLVVEDNPINQQIALKTIKKLKFSVSAVWNGQEALNYLLKPESAEHPRPDIILMDVQMPVMDGYKATYTIRHAEPFINSVRIQNTPIVAMTASAIQGDREKCESAGMNDYLSKPVKGKVLEKMLVKWGLDAKKKRDEKQPRKGTDSALAVRNKRQKTEHSASANMSDHQQASASNDCYGSDGLATESDKTQGPAPDALSTRLTELVGRSNETADVEVLGHLTHGEKATLLRNDQLIASGEDPKSTHRPVAVTMGSGGDSVMSEGGTGSEGPGLKLTKANMEKLEHGAVRRIKVRDEDSTSMNVTISEPGSSQKRDREV